jgi:hypothetical protein
MEVHHIIKTKRRREGGGAVWWVGVWVFIESKELIKEFRPSFLSRRRGFFQAWCPSKFFTHLLA